MDRLTTPDAREAARALLSMILRSSPRNSRPRPCLAPSRAALGATPVRYSAMEVARLTCRRSPPRSMASGVWRGPQRDERGLVVRATNARHGLPCHQHVINRVVEKHLPPVDAYGRPGLAHVARLVDDARSVPAECIRERGTAAPSYPGSGGLSREWYGHRIGPSFAFRRLGRWPP